MQNDKQRPGRKEPEKKAEDQSGESQKERSYYYDDAHGYELFDPEAADNDDDGMEEGEPSLPSDRC